MLAESIKCRFLLVTEKCLRISLLITTLLLFIIFIFPSLSSPFSNTFPLERRVNESDVIIEGEVINKVSYWNEDKTNIFTYNYIKVFKVFKGDIKNVEVIIKSRGGTVGSVMEKVSNAPYLNIGDIGLFFCKHIKPDKPVAEEINLRLFAGRKGFMKYDLRNDQAHDHNIIYKKISKTLYPAITTLTRENYRTLCPLEKKSKIEVFSLDAIAVTEFTPKTIPAGTNEKLTIFGYGFGSSQGNGVVWFYANDGGYSITASAAGSASYISWSDNKIELYVTENAGSGKILVENDSGQEAWSEEILSIPFAVSDRRYYNGQIINPALRNDNSLGGYTFHLNSELSESYPAAIQVLNAIQKWVCATGVNWRIGTDTSINSATNDNINVITFSDFTIDDPSLGRTHTFYIISDQYYLVEVDILMNSNVTWYFEDEQPGPDQHDFCSVLLHELGHAHLLGHVNDDSDVMYAYLGTGESKRTINSNNILGGKFIVDISVNQTSSPLKISSSIKCPKLENVLNLLRLLCGFDVDKNSICSFIDYDCDNRIDMGLALYMLHQISQNQ